MDGIRKQRAIVGSVGLLAAIVVAVFARTDSQVRGDETSAEKTTTTAGANNVQKPCEAPAVWFPHTPKPNPDQEFDSF